MTAALYGKITLEKGRVVQANFLDYATSANRALCKAIVARWAEQKVIREIMLFLHSNGVGTSHAVRITTAYSDPLEPDGLAAAIK
jgi:capsid protein